MEGFGVKPKFMLETDKAKHKLLIGDMKLCPAARNFHGCDLHVLEAELCRRQKSLIPASLNGKRFYVLFPLDMATSVGLAIPAYHKSPKSTFAQSWRNPQCFLSAVGSIFKIK